MPHNCFNSDEVSKRYTSTPSHSSNRTKKDLTAIKGISDAKVEKIQEAAQKLMVRLSINPYNLMELNRTECN